MLLNLMERDEKVVMNGECFRISKEAVLWSVLGHSLDINSLELIKRKGKVKVVPVLFLTEHHAMEVCLGSGGIAPRILDLGARWR
jgi:hypothetical protein